MRHIDKGREPRELVEYRVQSHATYDGYPHKDRLREALVADQGHLCAYCMRRIEPDTDHMKIEHWASQSAHPKQQLEWKNLLGVCRGGEGKPVNAQHCDTSKGDRAIVINPLEHPERYLRYLITGEIVADHPDVQRDVAEVLRLNCESLKSQRKAAWDALYEALKRRGDKAFREGSVRRAIEDLRGKKQGGQYQSFCGMLVYLLEKKLVKIQRR